MSATRSEAAGDPAGGRADARRSGRKIIVAGGIGNALEWYDWIVYAIFSPFFASQFFKSDDPTSALLSTLAVFAVGFLMRPIGGLYFGWLADRHGRRLAMTLAMIVTALGSLLIGLAPTYGVIGVGASAILLVARLGQGFGLGGEISGAYPYLAEMAPQKQRGLWSSSMYVFVTGGVTTATLMAAVLTTVIGPEAMTQWGWRIPFLIGGLLGLYAIWLRRSLDESVAFENVRTEESQPPTKMSPWRDIWEHRLAVLKVLGLTAGATVAYYTWAASATSYAITVAGVNPKQALLAGVVANLAFMISLPLWGALSDRWGRKPNLIFFSASLAALAYPLNAMINEQAWRLGIAMTVALICLASVASILPTVYAELFPTRVRAFGFAFPYSIAVAVVGGTAPYLQTWLTQRGDGNLFIGYSVALLLITLLTSLACKETAGKLLAE